jgi:hypothetical protein
MGNEHSVKTGVIRLSDPGSEHQVGGDAPSAQSRLESTIVDEMSRQLEPEDTSGLGIVQRREPHRNSNWH